MGVFKRSHAAGGPFRFRVSDSLDIPLRGHLVRLRLLDGTPIIGDLAIGRKLRLASPSGQDRVVTIVGHPVTGGNQTQARLDRTREMDVVISDADAGSGAGAVDIGWIASGPVNTREDRH